MTFRRYTVTGPGPDGEFVRPSRQSLKSLTFFDLDAAKLEAKELHEQFGDAFAIWFDDRIVAIHDLRGYIPLCPEVSTKK